jgi:hypothetical protein
MNIHSLDRGHKNVLLGLGYCTSHETVTGEYWVIVEQWLAEGKNNPGENLLHCPSGEHKYHLKSLNRNATRMSTVTSQRLTSTPIARPTSVPSPSRNKKSTMWKRNEFSLENMRKKERAVLKDTEYFLEVTFVCHWIDVRVNNTRPYDERQEIK